MKVTPSLKGAADRGFLLAAGEQDRIVDGYLETIPLSGGLSCYSTEIYIMARKSAGAATATTNMIVTSIRLEEELRQALKDLKHSQGYQFLVREVLWDYVRRNSDTYKPDFTTNNITGYIDGVANRESTCVLTQTVIKQGEPCQYAITDTGALVPVSMVASEPF